jgi:hypothetical protein
MGRIATVLHRLGWTLAAFELGRLLYLLGVRP